MKSILRVVLVVLVAGGIGGSVWYWKTTPPAADDHEIVLLGNIDIRQVELAFNSNERIAELSVEEGDPVQKGQLLAKLDTRNLEFAVQRAEALVEAQRQAVGRLEAGSRPEEINKARADVEAAEAVARDTQRTYQRELELVKSHAASQQEVDDARAAHESSEAQVKARKATLDLAVAGPRQEDIAEAKALLKRYESELDQAKYDLKEAFLYAPNDGIVQDRILEVGDMASPQKPVYTVALADPVWVRAYVSEPDLGKIWEGMKAVVTTDSFPGKQYAGSVGFISPTAEFTPKPVETRELRTKLVYQVRVFVENPNHELRLGMPATVTIGLDQSRVMAR